MTTGQPLRCDAACVTSDQPEIRNVAERCGRLVSNELAKNFLDRTELAQCGILI